MKPEPLTGRTTSLILLVASAVMLTLLIYVGQWLTFWWDEWDFIVNRRVPTVESLFGRHVDHWCLFPVLIYQALFRLAGLESYLPYLAVTWLLHLACVWILFWITAARAGWGLGLIAGLSLLFLGSGYEGLLQAFQLSFGLSQATGLAAIALLLRAPGGRPSANGPLAFCALSVAVASSAGGLLLVLLVILWTLFRRDWPGLVAAGLAFALWVAWFGIWGSAGRIGGVTSDVLTWAPVAIGHGLGAAVAGLAGAPPIRFATVGLALGLAGLVIARLAGARWSALSAAAACVLVIQYALVAALRPEFGLAWGARSQYVYLGGLLLWLVIPDLAAPFVARTYRWRGILVVGVLLLVPVGGNMMQFVGAARAMKGLRATVITELRLAEALRSSPDLDADVPIDPPVLPVTPRQYFEASDRLGRPRLACCEPSLAAPGRADVRALDRVVLRLLPAGPSPAPGGRLTGRPPTVRLESVGLAASEQEACTAVESGVDGGWVSWRPDNRAFAVRGVTREEVDIRVGVFSDQAEAVETALARAAARGEIIGLPRLPEPLQWLIRIRMPGRARISVCNAVAG